MDPLGTENLGAPNRKVECRPPPTGLRNETSFYKGAELHAFAAMSAPQEITGRAANALIRFVLNKARKVRRAVDHKSWRSFGSQQ